MSEWRVGHIEPFWDDEYKKLDYRKEPFNNEEDLKKWREQGYTHLSDKFPGMMCKHCLLYTSPSPRDGLLSRMPSSA